MATKYENIMVYSLTLGEEGIEAVSEKFKKIIEDGGNIEKVDVWGRRKLAYPINDEPDGYYVLTEFEAESDVVDELDRIAKITDGVLRWLTTRKGE